MWEGLGMKQQALSFFHKIELYSVFTLKNGQPDIWKRVLI